MTTNNNAIKRAVLEMQQSDKYEITVTDYKGMESYLINGVINVIPMWHRYKNLQTDEFAVLPPFTSKQEVMKILRKAVERAREHFISKGQRTIFE